MAIMGGGSLVLRDDHVPARWELGVGVEERRLGREVYQLWSQKSCVRRRALEAAQLWRKGSSQRSTCLSPTFVFQAFFFFFFFFLFLFLFLFQMTCLVWFAFVGTITLNWVIFFFPLT